LPVVSIIVPVFNRFECADRAIRSVINQTYTDWELFVVDDCSEPPYPLPDFCAGYSDRITLLRNEKNMGPGLSRQRGLDLSQGAYVCFLDSDDYFHPSFLEKSLAAHRQLPEVAGTYTVAENIDTGMIRDGSDISHTHIMPALFEHLRPWPTCAWMWKKKYLPRWQSLRTNQDSLFEIGVSAINNRIAHIPQVLCYIDKGTSENTADLVQSRASDRHRNAVARYALAKRASIKVNPSDASALSRAIVRRIVFTSGKLAGHGESGLIAKNGIKIFPLNPFLGAALVLLAIPVAFPLPYLRSRVKNILEKLYLFL
jgi:glycosyltransferase involved in cell wall biosynthesis